MSASSGGSLFKSLRRRLGLAPKLDLSDPVDREAYFRASLLRIVTACILFAYTVMSAILLPFYPVGLAIIFALVAAIIGYVLPPAGFLASIAVSIPPVAYQTGVPLWWLGILAVFSVAFAVRILLNPSNIFGPVFGLMASIITLTPAYFLAIPLMISVALSREKDRLFGTVGAVVMFLVFFIPIHQAEFAYLLQVSLGTKIQALRAEEIYDAMNTLAIPLFRQVSFAFRPAPESFDLPALSTAFDAAFRPSRYFHSYLFLMIDRLIILFFPVLITVTLSVSLVVGRFWLWLRDRGFRVAPVLRFSAIPTIIIGTAIFVFPLEALASPLRYYTAISTSSTATPISGSNALAALLASSVLMGLFLSMTFRWLSYRDSTATTASIIVKKGQDLRSSLDKAINHLSKIKENTEGIEIGQEIAEVDKANEEVRLTLKNYQTMNLSALTDRLTKFDKINRDFAKINELANLKLVQIYTEKVSKFNTIASQLSSFGIDAQRLPEPDLEQLETKSGDLINDQIELNSAYLELAKKVFSATKSVVDTIRYEFENVDMTSVEVSRRFIDEKKGEVALDYLINTLSQLEDRYGNTLQKTVEKEDSIMKGVLDIYSSDMLPMYETLGKVQSATKAYNVIAKFREMLNRQGPIGIAFMTESMIRFQTLEDGLQTIIAELASQLSELEALNDSRAPGFNWGKDTRLAIELESAIKTLKGKDRLEIGERINNAESVLKSIEGAATVISQYMVMSELILEYPLFEPLIITKLNSAGAVRPADIPAGQKYARQLLRLYVSLHQSGASYDVMTNKLQRKK
ncbi:MAG: hypothetical protein HYU02_07105 [Thaumarchaeota archaeon]|nr:hypothetical protein [Nitrososphaerota archaeon]